MSCQLYIDSDGTGPGTHLIVVGEDGSFLGELKQVMELDYHLRTDDKAQVKVTVREVSGRFLANKVLIHELRWRRSREWWRRLWRRRWIAT